MGTHGNLYIVATPIGNLDDITIRALSVLSRVDIIAAEDTRHTGRLLAHHQIRGRQLVSCHEHNEGRKALALIQRVLDGASVAVVTDAGTPSVSDPGYRIVRTAIEQGIQPVPLPGASAAVTALSASGLPTDLFTFIGFLPKKKGKRMELLAKLAMSPGTLIFYESPRRIPQLLDEIRTNLGERDIVLAREITKRYEEFLRGSTTDLIRTISRLDTIRGECTVLVSGKSPETGVCLEDLRQEIQDRMQEPGCSTASLARELADRHSVPRKQIYQEILNHIEKP